MSSAQSIKKVQSKQGDLYVFKMSPNIMYEKLPNGKYKVACVKKDTKQTATTKPNSNKSKP